MSAKKNATQKGWLRKWFPMIAMLLTGGGVGGLQLADYPVLSKVLSLVQSKAADPEVRQAISSKLESIKPGGAEGEIVDAVVDRLASAAGVPQSGIYEVKMDQLSVDPSFFPQGRTVNLQLRVRKIRADGKEATIWESEQFGERLSRVGRDPLKAGWSEQPFRVGWEPGEQFLVEIWNKRGLRDTRLFVMADPDGKGGFPLAAGSHSLQLVARDPKPSDKLEANSLAITSKRIGDLPESATARRGGEDRRQR